MKQLVTFLLLCVPYVLCAQAGLKDFGNSQVNVQTFGNRITVSIDSSGVIEGEIKQLEADEYYVQQFRWNKWITYDTIRVKGSATFFESKVPMHSGMNRIRIDVKCTKGIKCKGIALIEADFNKAKPGYIIDKSHLVFTSETEYEIYDQYGKALLKGKASKVDISSLPRGAYYLNYDNIMTDFNIG